MSETLNAALLYLITTVFDLYLFILIIRIVLVYVGAHYRDALTQFVVRFTDVIVKPVRRFIPNGFGIEWSTVLIVIILEIIKFCLLSFLSFGTPNPLGLIILASVDTIKILINCFFFAILIAALLSWIQPNSPLNRVLYQFTSPILGPMRRLLPPMGGFDLAPIPALILLQLLIIVAINPLMAFGLGVAFG